TSDRRDFAVGDVVTVLVDESTVASANRGSYASETRSRDLELGASGTGLAASLPATGARVGTGSAGESRQRGEATRATRFNGELSARVDSVGAGGLLRIRGRKVVDVDRNREEIAFTGWVRPQDVSRDNTVDSWRVADAELVYTGKGSLGKPRTGILGRILGMVWP
ncbi:MAG TPA: flagellar basal body L-ring protein FlgH, partial [Longimicrobiaceae bacterium]